MTSKQISETIRSDISTVIAYYTEEYMKSDPQFYGKNGTGYQKKCDTWSCFNGDYKVGKEHEFIDTIDSDKYAQFRISWSNCN